MKPFALIVLAIGVISAIHAAGPTPTQPPAPSSTPACVAPEFRHFDFWLGKWNVTNPQGNRVGTSEISRVSEGCAIREQWKSASGMNGMSINYYDATDHEWHQDWVGGDGTILHLHGGMKNGAMVLQGETTGAKGTITNRITWSRLPEGKVKQEWSTSSDDGANWQISFVGIYAKQS